MLVGIALVMLYVGYSQLTSPWLTIEQKQQKLVESSAKRQNSPAFLESAESWFKEDPWVRDANARIGDGSRLMYFQKYELFNEDRSIKVDPIAMLWRDDKSEEPYTLTARSAQLDATTKFKIDSNEFGAINSMQLQGDVRITGPDGLRIEGRTFSLSDNALKLTSSQPVKFWWGPHSGIAQSGVEIDLLSSANNQKQGLMAVTDVRKISLLGKVDCNLLFQHEDPHKEAVKLTINAPNGFDYFVPTHMATFRGFDDRRLSKGGQIVVNRPTVSGGLDRLYCSMLTLQLQPEVVDAGADQKRSPKLQLASIKAEGTAVRFESREQNIIATMSWLRYHIEERVMVLSGGTAPATSLVKPVQIHQNSSMVTASRVLIAHDEQNQPHSIQCLGSGRIEPSNLPSAAAQINNDVTFSADWTDSLVMFQLPEQKITLKGQVHLSQAKNVNESNVADSGTGISLSGDVIEMTGTLPPGTPVKADPGTASTKSSGFDFSRLNPRKLTATGNVVMTHNRVTGHINEKLTVDFAEMYSGNTGSNKTKTDSQSILRSDSSDDQGTTEFFCDTAKVNIEFERSNQKDINAQWKDVWLFGDVKIEHTGIKEDSDFSANGNALSAKSGFNAISELSLFGDPAHAKLAKRRIEGPRIDLRELDPSVDGPGSIRFVNDRGLNGKALDKPSVIEIYWTDSMKYSDRTATFIGNIRAVMTNNLDHKVDLKCASMKVYFTEELQIQSDKQKKNALQAASSTNTESGPIERIDCNSRVVVDIDQMKDTIVVSRNHAEFSDLKVNMLTGVFSATGSGSSGIIESTNPNSQNTPRTTSRAIARANTPVATPTDAFVFVQAKFIGSIEGNYKLQFVQLKQHVRGVFGPVRQMGDKIMLDGLNVNELPLNTGSMRCENLSFSQIQANDAGSPQFEMVAKSNASDGYSGTRSACHLESSEISGDADEIKYDSSKQQFILRADKGRQATVSYRPNPGGEAQTLTGEQFLYYRERSKLIASEITGVQTAGDLKPVGR